MASRHDAGTVRPRFRACSVRRGQFWVHSARPWRSPSQAALGVSLESSAMLSADPLQDGEVLLGEHVRCPG